MLPPDMQGPPAGGGGGDPIAALLAGAGAGGGGGTPPLPTEGTHGGGGSSLEQAIALLDQAVAEEADQEDQNVMRQCSAKLQQILAKDQAAQDAGLGGSVNPKAIRKQAGAY
jgi:hypothetical protein